MMLRCTKRSVTVNFFMGMPFMSELCLSLFVVLKNSRSLHKLVLHILKAFFELVAIVIIVLAD